MQGMWYLQNLSQIQAVLLKMCHASNTDGWSLLCSTRSRTGNGRTSSPYVAQQDFGIHLTHHGAQTKNCASLLRETSLCPKITSNLGAAPWTHHPVTQTGKCLFLFFLQSCPKPQHFPLLPWKAHPVPQAWVGKWWEERQQLRGLAFLCIERDLKPGWGYHDNTSVW